MVDVADGPEETSGPRADPVALTPAPTGVDVSTAPVTPGTRRAPSVVEETLDGTIDTGDGLEQA